MTDENKELQTTQALADVATDEDKLFRDGFVKGVSEFIKECPTPMTIAIQGDWGAGKTSLINLVEMELRVDKESEEDGYSDASKYCEDIIDVVNIDVWQQSIINPRVSLFEILLGEITSRLSGTSLSEVKGTSDFASAAANILSSVTDGGDDLEDDVSFGSVISSLFGSENNAKSESAENFVSVEEINTFQTTCVETLQQTAEYYGKSDNSRFVVFVDGLDYISPETAIDLLEQIKTYLECPRCVFVLAIDESVILDGARKKLGDKVDEGRKKMLFDRYIQVPLRIPIGAYNLDKYIKDLLKDEKELSGELAEVISALLSAPTPRRIKRYINTMYLYQSIFGWPENTDDSSLAMLLAAVILKAESGQGFNAIANCAESDGELFAENLEAAVKSLSLNDGIDRAMLPTLWSGEEGADVDVAKRDAFLSWIRKLK